MILSTKTVVHYLLEHDLLPAEAVVNGDAVVVEVSRRNRNFKILRGEAPGFFVKQIQSWEPQSTAALQREALCYWMAARDSAFARLGEIMPKYHYYDPPRSILVSELHKTGDSLAEYHRRSRQFPQEIGDQLGRALAIYHNFSAAEIQQSAYRGAFPKIVPWILSLHHQAPGSYPGVSAGNVQMIGLLKRYPDFQKHLDALRAAWQPECLIHGDMKWDNCLLEGENPSTGRSALRIVDWELADVGDPGWDIGAVFQAYLSFWILSLPVMPGMTVEQMIARAPFPLESTHPALRSFWSAYERARPLEKVQSQALLERSAKYAAARMIQTVYEYMHQSPQLTGTALCLMQASHNMLCRPEEAQRELLGL